MPKEKKGDSGTRKPPEKSKVKKWGIATKEREEHATRDVFLDENTVNTIKDDILKLKMITPAVIAQKYNARISVVKQILRELLEENKIKKYATTNKLKIYVAA